MNAVDCGRNFYWFPHSFLVSSILNLLEANFLKWHKSNCEQSCDNGKSVGKHQSPEEENFADENWTTEEEALQTFSPAVVENQQKSTAINSLLSQFNEKFSITKGARHNA